MKCEHCGYPDMRGWILCRRCWKIFADDAMIPTPAAGREA